MMIVRTITVFIAVVAFCFSAGCGIFKSSTTQASVESSSKSSAASSRSSSGSSSPSEESPSAYERDVTDYTAKFAVSGGDAQAFQRDVSAMAEEHGVTDWEQDDATYEAIGRGLAKAGLGEQGFQDFVAQLSSANHGQLGLVKSGYETYDTP